jgi:hypothetical protein
MVAVVGIAIVLSGQKQYIKKDHHLFFPTKPAV